MIQRIARGLLPVLDPDRPPPVRHAPLRVLLGVRDGHRPSPKPPVRVFIGTERAQFRAERVMLWSIEKHRDPSRLYEIHLLHDLAGFRRRFWLTGFTNYRFAIPSLCGYRGRAIYNDVDQVYLTDPAELFDADMDGAGFLSISDRDTSVMLLDCERLAEAWHGDAARRLNRHQLEARARSAGLWGALDPGWNARDREYRPGQSKLVHFTTLHTQPWRPFPGQFVYYDNPTDPLWSKLEAEADAAGFLPVSARRPSADWAAARVRIDAQPDGGTLLARLEPDAPPARVSRLEIDAGLELVPDADMPWVLARLYECADAVELAVHEPLRGGTRRGDSWWAAQLAQASSLVPHARWRLQRRCGLHRRIFEGGPPPAGPVVVLTHDKPGHDQQARTVGAAIASATGRECIEREVPWGDVGWVLRRTFGHDRRAFALPEAAVIVAGGWRPTRVAARVPAADGAARVLLGRKAGRPPDGGVVVQCAHFGLPPHPRRLRTRLPLNRPPTVATTARDAWTGWCAAPRRYALLLGGNTRAHVLPAGDAAAIVRRVQAWARDHNARLLVVSSRRTPSVALDAAAAELDDDAALWRWSRDAADNPYPLALTEATAVVVTGESESMLADAVAAGVVPLIVPLPERAVGPWARLSAAVAARARRPVYNRRGSIRPQQGLAYLCARAVERGLVLPPRELAALHARLCADGLAAMFDAQSPSPRRATPVAELDDMLPAVLDTLQLTPAAARGRNTGEAADG